jgi:signal transduction histidine kinase
LPASLRARLALTFALVVTISLLAAAGSLAALLRGYSTRLVEARLDDVATVMVIQARNMLQRGESPAQVLDFFGEQADRLEVRILLLDREGLVLREAGGGPSLLGQRLAVRQEGLRGSLRQPLHGRIDSTPDRITYQYSAIPLGLPPGRAGEPALLAVAQPEGSLLATLGSLLPRLGLAAAAGLAAGLFAAVLLARWLGRPLTRLLAATRAMARGDYSQRVPLEGPSELVRLSDSFNAMATEVERSRQIVQRFVSTLSHELRTPLTSIRGFAQAVLDGSAWKPEDVHRAMRIVDHEARRMQRLTAELLDLSRLQAGQVPMRREPVDLAALVHHCAEVLGGRAQERRVGLEIDLSAEIPIQGDADRLEQVFANLLDNAIKFTPPGASVRVSARWAEIDPLERNGLRENRQFDGPSRAVLGDRIGANHYVMVQIANPGPPIPTNELSRVFEPFYTGSIGHERGGTGLGLAIAREIARAHGGDITAESGPDETVFSVALPNGRRDRDAAVTAHSLTAASRP